MDVRVEEETKVLEARKRTAVDGKEWWCVWDTVEKKWSTLMCFGKYKTKFDCEWAIKKYF